MSEFIVTKRLQNASIAHRLRNNYSGKCLNIHAHLYKFEVDISVNKLNQFDMAIDFGDIKKLCDNFIQNNWDHATIVNEKDLSFREFLEKEEMNHFIFKPLFKEDCDKEVNTTAELMSEYLSHKFLQLLHKEGYQNIINWLIVRVWETEDSYATYRLNNRDDYLFYFDNLKDSERKWYNNIKQILN